MSVATTAVAAPPATFLVGAPRSGTTLLYKCLCLHPDAAWLSNWVRRFPGRPALSALNRVAARTPGRRRASWFSEGGNAYVYGGRREVSERLYPMPVEGEPFFERFGLPGPGGRPNGTPRLDGLAAAVARVVRSSGGTVFVSKRIAHNWRVPLLAEAFPAARFVEIVRDGRAVACSLRKVDWWDECDLGWRPGTPRDWEADGGDPWELCARHWVAELDALASGLAAVAPGQRMRVSYEAFVAEPAGTLAAVAAFAGLRPDPAWQEAVAGLSFPPGTDAWRRSLPPAALATIESVQHAHLEANGYALG